MGVIKSLFLPGVGSINCCLWWLFWRLIARSPVPLEASRASTWPTAINGLVMWKAHKKPQLLISTAINNPLMEKFMSRKNGTFKEPRSGNCFCSCQHKIPPVVTEDWHASLQLLHIQYLDFIKVSQITQKPVLGYCFHQLLVLQFLGHNIPMS